MDRREFCQTIFVTPLLSPFLAALKIEDQGLHLYIISDIPQMFIPSIFEELERYGLVEGHNFTFLNSHPEQKSLSEILSKKGWKFVSSQSQTNLLISSNRLHHPTRSSFSLIKGGSILDIRTNHLKSIWNEMHFHRAPSKWLTTISFQPKKIDLYPGKYVSISINGHRIKKIPLNKNFSAVYQAHKGFVKIEIEQGKALVSGSSCVHQICKATLPVQYSGERIICAPNRFFLEIQGTHSIDAIIG
jgi:hypothetical protein